MTKSYLGKEMVYFSLQLVGPTPSLREVGARAQGRNPEARTEVKAMEEYCLLACSPDLLRADVG